jgi:hypothetical protein
MMLRILIAIAVISALLFGKDLLLTSTSHSYDAIFAFILALVLAPWIERQLD